MDSKKAIRLQYSSLKNLSASLEAMRTEEYADVTLVCKDKQFGAHKLILEASSPYFKAMFCSGLEEAKTGKLVYKSIEPDTMEAILKYIYVGKVDTLNTQEQVTDVLAASHFMQLSLLSEYCFDFLYSLMSIENFVEIWAIASIYAHQKFTDKVLGYVLSNFKELKKTRAFMQLSDLKLKEILNFVVKKQVSLDNMLCFVLAWLRHDVRQRKECVNGLFSCIEPKLLSPYRLKVLLRDKTIMTISPDITNKMNELGLAVLLLEDERNSTIQLEVSNLSNITEDVISDTKMIQNLPWNVFVQQETKGKIGFYVQCDFEPDDKSWSCKANIEYNLLSCENLAQPIITRKCTRFFCSEKVNWGFPDFIELDEDPDLPKNCVSSEGTFIFEAKINADTPKGIADY